MTPIYSRDCSCGFPGEMPRMRRINATTDAIAAREFARLAEVARAEARTDEPPPARYFVVHGPGGHVIGVR